MRSFLTLTIAVALFVSVTPIVLGQSAADEAAIREASKQFEETVNRGDINSHLDLHTDPHENFAISRDRAAHQQSHERLKDLHLTMLDDIGVVFVTSDVAIHKFHREASGSIDDDGNPLPPSKSLVAQIYVKKDGKWLTTAVFSRPIEE